MSVCDQGGLRAGACADNGRRPGVPRAGGCRGRQGGVAWQHPSVRIDVVTIFPGYLAPLREALLGRAIERRARRPRRARPAELDPRRPPGRRRRPVRRRPGHGDAAAGVGRGPRRGARARRAAGRGSSCPPRPVVRSPRPTAQAWAAEPAAGVRLRPLRGHRPAGGRRRPAPRMPVDEVSIGDYVLVGGEVAVLVMVEAVVRLLPGRARQPGVGAAGLVLRRAAGGPGLHPAGDLARAGRARTCCAAATTPRSPAGGATGRSSAPPTRRPDLLAALPDGRARRRRPGLPRAPGRGRVISSADRASGTMDWLPAPDGACPAPTDYSTWDGAPARPLSRTEDGSSR